MSLILEALRKSEAERRRGSTPDVAMELPPAPLRTRNAAPSWLWPVVLLVLAIAPIDGEDAHDARMAATGRVANRHRRAVCVVVVVARHR